MITYRPLHALIAWREERGIDQVQLAKLLGTSPTTICRWEAGAGKPRERTIKKIMEVTGLGVLDLRPDIAELVDGVSRAVNPDDEATNGQPENETSAA